MCCTPYFILPFCHSQVLSPSGVETDTPVTFEAVYSEFNSKYAEPQRIMKFTSRRVTRRYAFDQSDVPQESEYLQVMYSADYEALPMNASGKTFSRVFGTNTSRYPRLYPRPPPPPPAYICMYIPDASCLCLTDLLPQFGATGVVMSTEGTVLATYCTAQ